MFPLTFPYSILKEAKKGDLILDPFCGRGTTNYAARLRGLSSYGVDSNPVAHAIAQAKLVNVKPREVVALCLEILLHTTPKKYPKGEFWEWAYHPDTLVDVCKLRQYFSSKPRLDRVDIALRALCLGILHGPIMKTEPSYLSNQMPRTFATKPDYSVRYWESRDLEPKQVNVLSLVKRKAQYIFNAQLPKKSKGKIILSDSRRLTDIPEEKFDWIITSPPYFGMVTYEQDQWLRNWFLGGSDSVYYPNPKQLKHGSEGSFNNDLAKVWKNVAKRSKSNAKMVIRFGALPSLSQKTPTEIIKESLQLSEAGWKIDTVRNAGKANAQHRQANQFKNSLGGYIEEIDVYAALKN